MFFLHRYRDYKIEEKSCTWYKSAFNKLTFHELLDRNLKIRFQKEKSEISRTPGEKSHTSLIVKFNHLSIEKGTKEFRGNKENNNRFFTKKVWQ